jgi:hypothetical protein
MRAFSSSRLCDRGRLGGRDLSMRDRAKDALILSFSPREKGPQNCPLCGGKRPQSDCLSHPHPLADAGYSSGKLAKASLLREGCGKGSCAKHRGGFAAILKLNLNGAFMCRSAALKHSPSCPIPVGKQSRTFPRPISGRYEIQGFHTSLIFCRRAGPAALVRLPLLA